MSWTKFQPRLPYLLIPFVMEQDEILALNSVENTIFGGAFENKYIDVFIDIFIL
ncbi:hypothetical protein SAMN05216334_11255 [Nitrosomonas ureae]|uniref:Uncharacterized protein n=1 Tax=Nitrosomonas ureae TaxID=44577 RepID=A0A1H5VEH2_9PROT|nr:hypothetical protein SAMN05216334_11255 [Nitrosomonas ureae]